MHAPQNKMPFLVRLLHILDSLLRRGSPSEKDHTPRSHLGHGVDDLLCEELPPFARMRVGLVAANSEARVYHEDAIVCPGGQEPAFLRRLFEVRIVFLQRDVDVAERGRGGGGRAHGEAEAVGLVGIVVGILTCDDSLDGVERRVARPGSEISWACRLGWLGMKYAPGIHVLHRGVHCLPAFQFLLEEALQLEEAGADQHLLQVRQPALMQRVDLQLEQLLLLVGKLRDPRVLVKFCRRGRALLGLGGAEERRDAAIDLCLLRGVGSGVGSLALETHRCVCGGDM